MILTKGVSVIITSYNIWKMVWDALNSILKVIWDVNYQIIVVDDASNDIETIETLNQYFNIGWIEIIKLSQNLWVQNARTIWLNKAKYDYIFILDWDDCLNTDKNILKKGNYIKDAINILDKDPSIALVHCPSIMFGDYNWYTISPYPIHEDLVLKKHHVSTFSIYRREDALDVKWWMYNNSIKKWQDWSAAIWLFNARFLRWKKNNVWFLKYPYFLYRAHDSPNRISISNIDEKEMIRKTISLYPDIFCNYYKNLTKEEIVDVVYNSKPNKLTDLLYVAYLNSFKLALKIIKERKWALSWNWMSLYDLLKIASYKWVNVALKIIKEKNLYIIAKEELGNIP